MNEQKLKRKAQSLRNLIKTISFIIVFAILLSVTSRIVIPKSNRDLKQYSAAGFYGEPKNSLDYVVIGDSNAPEGFSPLEVWKSYGYAGYVCGEPFQTACGAFHLLREVLSRQKPKLVILEMNIFYAISEKSSLLSGNSEMTDLEKSLSTELSSKFPVIRYHNRWKTLTSRDLISKTDYSWKHATKGYSFSKIQGTCNAVNYMKPTTKIEGVNRTSLLYLFRIISLCKKNNIKLLFLSVPCPSTWSNMRHNAIDYISKCNNVPYVDLNEMVSNLGIDLKIDTRDGIHLNYYGAQKASQYVGDYINKNNQFPDHRNDENYSAWNQDLQNYESAVNG